MNELLATLRNVVTSPTLPTIIVAVVGLYYFGDTAIAAYDQWARSRRFGATEVKDVVAFTPENSTYTVRGTVREHEESLTAPFSGDECIAYVCDVYETTDAPTQEAWARGASDSVPFVIDDGTGTALVEGTDTYFGEEYSDQYHFRPGDTVSTPILERTSSTLEAPRIPETAPDDGLILQEFRLEPGAEVYASGPVTTAGEAMFAFLFTDRQFPVVTNQPFEVVGRELWEGALKKTLYAGGILVLTILASVLTQQRFA